MSRFFAVVGAVSLASLFQLGCCPAVVASSSAVGTGEKGVLVRAFPAGLPVSAPAGAGLVKLPEEWPQTTLLHKEACEKDVDELKELEASLGASISKTTCAQIQQKNVAPTGEPEPDGDLPATDEVSLVAHCYRVGDLLLVVDALEDFKCKHIVGLALFKRTPDVPGTGQ